MTPLEFIFALLTKYVPVNPGRFESIKSDANKWWMSDATETNRIGKWLKENGEKWWVMLILAMLFIPMTRWIADFMNPKIDENPEKSAL